MKKHPSSAVLKDLNTQARFTFLVFSSKKTIASLGLVILFATLLHGQVDHIQLDRIASHILTVNNINLRGDIIVDARGARGMAATTGNWDYSVIYVDPYQMRRLPLHVWAYILGHELANQYMGHSPNVPDWKKRQQEFEADRIGALWAYRAGYNVNTYLRYMASQPNVCTSTHGCWEDRIQNIMNMFGLPYYSNCR
jgi:Putative Zn-dependent protease, contains TPR repeats